VTGRGRSLQNVSFVSLGMGPLFFRNSMKMLLGVAAATAIIASASPAQATATGSMRLLGRGCNHSVCLEVAGGAGFWRAGAMGYGFWGHVDIISPDGERTNGADGQNPTITLLDATGHAGQVCAEGWKWVGDRYVSVGYPCVSVS
jgi:hypothetical protein